METLRSNDDWGLISRRESFARGRAVLPRLPVEAVVCGGLLSAVRKVSFRAAEGGLSGRER